MTNEKICSICGKPFTPDSHYRVCCSIECSMIYRKKYSNDIQKNKRIEKAKQIQKIKCSDCGIDFAPANPRYFRCPCCAKFFREHHRPYGIIEPDQKFMVSPDGTIIKRKKRVCNYIKTNVDNAVSRQDPESIFFSPGFISKFIPEVVLCDTDKIIAAKEKASQKDGEIASNTDRSENEDVKASFYQDKEKKLERMGDK